MYCNSTPCPKNSYDVAVCSVLECFLFVAPAASRLNKNEPYAIAHLKLMKDDDTTIEDGQHELYVYKVSRAPKTNYLL